MVRILALDLSLSATGWAHEHGHGVMETSPRDERELRLDLIRSFAVSAPVDLIVIEDFVTRSPAASVLGMVHGVVRHALWAEGQPFALVPPASLKRYATGKGNATKADMRMALFQRAGLDVRDDNAVDAWWLRAMALDHYGHPLVAMPQTHRQALDKVAWPATEVVAS